MKLDVAFKSDQQFGAKIEEKEQSFPVDFSGELDWAKIAA